MSNIKESYWDADRRESHERIEGLIVQSEKLRRDTAEATAQAETERLARIKLEAEVAPRRISGENANKMASILSKTSPVTLVIVSRLLDSEGKDFADDIKLVLTRSHWTTLAQYENWTESEKGLFMATVEGTEMPADIRATLTAAFAAANIALKTKTITGDEIQRASPWFQMNVLYLLVGSKP
jgi:hypothetical protein